MTQKDVLFQVGDYVAARRSSERGHVVEVRDGTDRPPIMVDVTEPGSTVSVFVYV